MILANKGPIIIKNNTFEENIGTTGGAIHIMSPDFEYKSTNLQSPYIYIASNSFIKNMAYFAGNAYYITHTVKRIESFVDYLNMCGAGVMIIDNLF